MTETMIVNGKPMLVAEVDAKLNTVELAHELFGVEYAQGVWEQLGLPNTGLKAKADNAGKKPTMN